MTLYLSEKDVQRVLTMPVALEMTERAMRDRALGLATDVARVRATTSGSAQRILQATAPGLGYIGFKYTYAQAGRRCTFVHLINIRTAELEAIIDSDWMGMVRTGAASGMATRCLANPGATVLAQLGAGRQGYGQLEAVCLTMNIRKVQVFARNRANLEAFCAAMAKKLGIDVSPASSGAAALDGAQVVNVITKSAEPVLLGEWLQPGQHINAAGSNALSRRELDEAAVRRCDVITVDSRSTASQECGDLLHAVEQKRLDWEALPEIGEVMTGTAAGRTTPQQITLYESHGMGIQDLYVGARVFELARAAGIGTSLPLDVPKDSERVVAI